MINCQFKEIPWLGWDEAGMNSYPILVSGTDTVLAVNEGIRVRGICLLADVEGFFFFYQ